MRIGIDGTPASRREKTGVEWYTWHLLQEFMKADTSNEYSIYTLNPFPEEELAVWPSNFKQVVLKSFTKWYWPQTRLTPHLMSHKPDRLFIPADAMPLVQPHNSTTTIHDIAFIPYKDIYEFKRRTYLYWTTWHATKTAKKILTVSEFTKGEIVKYYGVNPDRIIVTHLGYDADTFVPVDANNAIADSKILFELGLSGVPYILTISPLERKKNLPTLIDAFSLIKKEYPDLKLVIAGKPRLAAQEIQDKIAQSRYKDDIISLGWITQDQKLTLLRNAQVFTFPTFYEGFGLPIIEAQSCAVPVVCSKAASLPEVGGDGALYHETTNIEDLADKVLHVLRDSELEKSLITKGLANATRFSWQECAKKSLEVILK